METKLGYAVSISVIIILIVSGIVLAKTDKEVKVFKPSKSFVDEESVKNIIVSRGVHKRVIADEIDEDGIKLFKYNGCSIKHRLKHSASFECPEDVISKLNVREARIFHILDLEADRQIKADQVWAEGIKGEGANVVILDTGIDSSHIELSDSIKGQKDFVNNDDVAEDDNGHGTHVAGIITANGVYKNIDGTNDATGVSPSAGIYMLKVCDASGLCYEDDIMAAMEYAVNNLGNARIMSISIGNGNFNSHCDSDKLAAKVNWVVDNGFTVVVAAGNEGKGVSSPACASKAIAVGAVDKKGVIPYWSNRGSALDIVAPGVNILSTYSCLAAGNCGYYWYAYMSGTSMSAPHVSGVIALLLETKPTVTTDEIKNVLYSTASPATKCYKCITWSRWSGGCYRQSEVACTSDITGAGIVNAYEAYLAIKPIVCEPTPEICDNKDNDCDGSTDEDLTQATTCGVGACSGNTGTETCTAGVWGGDTCNPFAGATAETCDNIDNDCDGLIDENLGTTTCGIGACQRTVDNCVNGVPQTCTPGSPNAETCNGIDDDCDGDIDEGGVCEMTKCWNAEHNYLVRSSSQFKKFCKCAQGNYAYKSYSYNRGKNTAYYYVDTGNNENWETKSTSTYYPVYKVKCADRNWYNTNQDYYE